MEFRVRANGSRPVVRRWQGQQAQHIRRNTRTSRTLGALAQRGPHGRTGLGPHDEESGRAAAGSHEEAPPTHSPRVGSKMNSLVQSYLKISSDIGGASPIPELLSAL